MGQISKFPLPKVVSSFMSLSNDDGDGYENVTQKVNLRCLKLNRPYSISFNSSNFGVEFERIVSKSRKRKPKLLFSVSDPPISDFAWFLPLFKR